MNIGVISDTHGLMRPEALGSLEGSELILHAGDVGSPSVLDSLRAIARVIAVRGNVDKGAWANSIPKQEIVEVGSLCIYMLHDLNELDLDPVAAGFRVVISGHSHKPLREERNGVLYLNPGSAGPRRFNLPITVALLRVNGTHVAVEITQLSCD